MWMSGRRRRWGDESHRRRDVLQLGTEGLVVDRNEELAAQNNKLEDETSMRVK